MSWNQTTLRPRPEPASKFRVRYPCPGICRFLSMVAFLLAALVVYGGGLRTLGLEPLNMLAPAWTAKHVALVVIALLSGSLTGLAAFAYGMKIEVRSERLSDFLITLWQFLANGGMAWVVTIGIAMSVVMGRDVAKAAVLRFGAERATIHVVGTGAALGVLMGAAFSLARIRRCSFLSYLTFAEVLSLFAAWWHFQVYALDGRGWIVPGAVFPFLLLLLTPSMIERDRQQRRLAMEQSE